MPWNAEYAVDNQTQPTIILLALCKRGNNKGKELQMRKYLKVAAFVAAAVLALGIFAGCSSSGSSSASASGSASASATSASASASAASASASTSASASATSASASASATSAAASASSAADGSYKLVKDGTLTVISSLDFPPFENLENGEAVGFEMDLIREIANRMGLQVDIQNKKFDTLVPAIAAGGSADVSISGITITPEREEQVLFTDSVCDSNQAIVVMKDSGITSVSQLEGKKIAAQSGTTGSDWAKENIPGATVTDYDEATACFVAIQSGQADAVSIDLPVAQYNVKNSYQDATIIQETPTGEQLGIAVSKDNAALHTAINDVLKAMKADGSYQAIYDKWFTV